MQEQRAEAVCVHRPMPLPNKVLRCFPAFLTVNEPLKWIMRAFVRLRVMLATHADLARRLNELEQKIRRAIPRGLRSDPRTNYSRTRPSCPAYLLRKQNMMPDPTDGR